MTLKGHKNHYNMKLLRGHGASITLKGSRVCLKDGSDPFIGQVEKEEWFVTQIPYEKIVIAGKGYVSTEAIQLLTEHNINVILLDPFGNLVCNMGRTTPSFRISLAMEKEECKLALKMGKIASSYRIIVAFVIM